MSNVRRRDLVKGEEVQCWEQLHFLATAPRCVLSKESVAKVRTSMYRESNLGRFGISSSTLPLVKSMHATALARTGLRPSPPVALVSTGGEPNQTKATVPPFRSVPVGSVKSRMAAAQATTPNPSIEGMPKRLRLLVTPHVKR
jgi:hypothetical protein